LHERHRVSDGGGGVEDEKGGGREAQDVVAGTVDGADAERGDADLGGAD
jgi:hypothetical protein